MTEGLSFETVVFIEHNQKNYEKAKAEKDKGA